MQGDNNGESRIFTKYLCMHLCPSRQSLKFFKNLNVMGLDCKHKLNIQVEEVENKKRENCVQCEYSILFIISV